MFTIMQSLRVITIVVSHKISMLQLEMNPQMDNLRGLLDDYYTDPDFVCVNEQTKQKRNKKLDAAKTMKFRSKQK